MTEWRDIKDCPKDGSEFLAYDIVAGKADVCSWLGGGVQSTQLDREYGQLDDDFRPERARHWKPIIPPVLE